MNSPNTPPQTHPLTQRLSSTSPLSSPSSSPSSTPSSTPSTPSSPPIFVTQTSQRLTQISAKLKQSTKISLPIRIMIAALGVFACLLLSSTRYNLSIAIVSMVDDSCTPRTSICARYELTAASTTTTTNSSQRENVSLTFDLSGDDLTAAGGWRNHSVNERERLLRRINVDDACVGVGKPGKLAWSEAEQGVALGVYYYGFATTHIFGGRLAERTRWGPKWITAIGLIGAAIFNTILPVASKLNFIFFLILRVIIGAFHGFVHPALYSLFQNWFPKSEQSTALSLLLLGTSLGLIVNVPIVSAIGDLDWLSGWPLLFYGGSALHIVWIVLWAVLVADRPEEHGMINDREIGYIRQNSQNILETDVDKAPWRSIIKSRALYASIIAKVSWSFNHAVIIDNGPSYLNKILGFDMFGASVHVAVVYLFTSAIFLSAGPLFGACKKLFPFISQTGLRKFFQSLVFIGAAVTMFILPSVGCDERMIILLIIINMISQGFVAGGEHPLLNEYSGNYSGTVYGIAITFDSFARFLAPIIRGELVKNDDSLPNWNIVFYITGALNVIALIVFNCFATSTPQEWALKKDMVRQFSDDGVVTKIPLDKPAKREIRKELDNPNFRLAINTEEEDWKQFKVATLVQ